jgi:hypothetical protein
MKRPAPKPRTSLPRRRGAGSLEFVLVLGVILPLVGIALPATRTMSQRVYEMTSTLISWPFL